MEQAQKRVAASDDPSDYDLLLRSAAGDESAFILLYEKLKPGIYRYAFYMTGSRPASEEILQEAFISLLREAGKYRPDRGDVAAFAFGIARNLVRRMERRERNFESLTTADEIENAALTISASALPTELIRNETIERVQAAVASLPYHYRQVVVLCDLCELSYADAASRLECAIGTVRSRLNRAHHLLAEKLKTLKSAEPNLGPAGTEGCLI